MNIYRYFILSALALCASLAAEAAQGYRSIVVNRTDGTSMTVNLQSDIEASIAEGNLKLTSAKGNIILPVSDVRSWSFSSLPGGDEYWTAINGIGADSENVAIYYADRLLSVSGLAAGVNLSIVAIDGRVCYSSLASGDLISVDLSAYPAGVYVVACGGRSFKIAIR